MKKINSILKKDPNLELFRNENSRFSDKQVNNIIFVLNELKKENERLDPTDYEVIKQKIINNKLTDEQYIQLFEVYELEPYDEYLKKRLFENIQL